ncbi:MAG: UDP-4-amino-4-deoxy-L-arabinose--oxoglutarate aminotransferase [Methanomassiliicoccales archaeon PtaU1.Bin030]|nr:MAG: UDP-4-amino-4-deoxy-L-arabinose--oxoglutarate aminotransferase [Methanomassiliicoccales archaeon PtaU1.Bin030]
MAKKGRMKVRVGDLVIGPEEREAIMGVLDSGKISEGRCTRSFELEWATYIGTKDAVATNSGTSALISGLTALHYVPDGIAPGSKIVTTPLTYAATSNAIILTGHEPVFVDVDADTFGITTESIREELEHCDDPSEYSTLLPVHLMGYPCDLNGILRIARENDMVLFEDSAQAHGSIYDGRRTGSIGRLAAFSFYIAHNIQVGELGAVTSSDEALIRRVRQVKANGRMCDCPRCMREEVGCVKRTSVNDHDARFTHEIMGYNFKTMEFQTALANVQLKIIESIIKRRQENVRYLNDGLSALSGTIKLPTFSNKVSYLGYPVVIEDSRFVRNRVLLQLEDLGVETRPLFGCIPLQQPSYSAFKHRYEGCLPNAEYLGAHAFYIGCHQYLTEDDLDMIIRTFKEVFA